MTFVPKLIDHKLKATLTSKYAKQLEAMTLKNKDEREGREKMNDLVILALADNPDLGKNEVKNTLFKIYQEKLREKVLGKQIRGDGRKPDEVRPIEIEIGVLARTHGSTIFNRGTTQALSIVTLGSPSMEQQIESMIGEESKRYMHHYFFPPFSVGEAGRLGWPSRREVGHGALAERALEPVIPSEDVFPYTIRVVSEILSSNGSTSMASVCGSTLSLMDAGVPIKAPVAGVAMGLVKDDKSDKYVILTDITGQEDHIGDMDFKVAGTAEGITALQMDIKTKGVSGQLLREALDRARVGRLHILNKMTAAIASPRTKLSQYAPQIAVLHIEQTKIGEVIGPGGRMIRKIIAETGSIIDVDDDGKVTVAGQDKEKVAKAIEWIEGLVREVQAGEVFDQAPVRRILDFGAFVEILPGKEGLVHVSKMSPGYVGHPSDMVKIDDLVKVHVEEIDTMGRINLSMLFDEQGKPVIMPKQERRERSGGGFNNRPSFGSDRRRPFQRDRGRDGGGRSRY
jgi:polyribonucleotide nucleotidyltransferase